METAHSRCRQAALVLGSVLTAEVFPAGASAHVKWFCTNVDVSSPPLALRQILNPFFIAAGSGFFLLIMAGSYADGWIARLWPRSISTGDRVQWAEDVFVRAGIALYCAFLWNRTAVVPLVLWRRTCPVAAGALAGLFILGIIPYGAFHMTDYVYFIGFIVYLALTAARRPVRAFRLPVLGATLGFSLMWTAVEKFLYLQWTAQILLEHPDITAGLPVASVIVIAGFVEFSLAFYLVVGRGLLRVGALAFMIVFISAIPQFGRLDSVGHIPIIAILLAIILRGASPLQNFLRLRNNGPAVNMMAMCGLYVAILIAMTAAYYAMQLTVARA